MLVTDIEITDYQYCDRLERHRATVGVTLKDHFITLLCKADLPKNAASTRRARAFVEDAVRQLHRMPEVRSGAAAVDFAADFDMTRLRSA